MPQNQVRIIGGFWKGRKLGFTPGLQCRPSLSRVRETLFNWLAPTIAGSNCLDLFAGSGALGFEALSRGARSLVLVDADLGAAHALRQNGRALGTERLLVRRQRAQAFLKQAQRRGIVVAGERLHSWDCIFLDPPFTTELLPKTLALLADGSLLRPNGLVYFETRRAAPLDIRGWSLVRDSQAADTRFGLLRLVSVLSVGDQIVHHGGLRQGGQVSQIV